MKSAKTLDSIKNPKITIDPSLRQYKDVVICPEKVEKAKKTIERLGLPDLNKIK